MTEEQKRTGKHSPQQPYIRRSDAEVEALFASMSSQQLVQAAQMFKNMDQDQVTQLLRTMGAANQMSNTQINGMYTLIRQFQDMGQEQLQQIAEQMKAFSPEQLRTAGEAFQTATKDMNIEQSRAMADELRRMQNTSNGQKDGMGAIAEQLKSVNSDQVKNLVEAVVKAQVAGKTIDIEQMQDMNIPLVQNMLSVKREPEHAIERYTREIATLSRERNPFQWAQAHVLRGSAYRSSATGDQNVNLEHALADLNTALTIFNAENAPHAWGTIMMMRATLYLDRQQGQFATDAWRAAADCEAAMHIFPRETMPEQWALAKGTRASAYSIIARIIGHYDNLLEKAIDDCTDALSLLTYQQKPEEWIHALTTRCFAHSHYETGDLQKHKELAIADANMALQVLSKETYTRDWALLHAYRSIAYWKSTYGNRQQNIEKAMKDCEAALTVYSLKETPGQWAMLLTNRAMIRIELGQGDLREHIELSLRDIESAIDALSKETHPLEWANAQLGCAILYQYRTADEQAENLKFAFASCNLALEVFTKEQTPVLWGQTLVRRGLARYGLLPRELRHIFTNSLGLTQLVLENLEGVLGYINASRQLFTESYADFDMALTALTKENAPTEYAWAHLERAHVYEILHVGNSNEHPNEHSEQANSDYDIAQSIFTPENKPFEWAWMQIGFAMKHLPSSGDYTSQILQQKAQQALHHLEAALRIYTAQAAPIYYRMAQILRALAYERLDDWLAAHQAWQEARKARRSLMETALSEQGRSDREIALTHINIYTHDAQALLRCTPPDVGEAVVALEEGRAQGLRLALNLDSLDPQKIENRQARKRAEVLLTAREHWRHCQQRMEHLFLEKNITEQSETCQQYMRDLQMAHDDILNAIDVIRSYDDPDFMSPISSLTNIAEALTAVDEALVYLVAGSYFGHGMTNALFGSEADTGIALIVMREGEGVPVVHALELPLLNWLALDDLIPRPEASGSRVTGIAIDQVIRRMGELGMNDIVVVLQQSGVRRVTFVPYGPLSLFPLTAIQVTSLAGKTAYLGDLFEVCVAPSARSCAISRRRAVETRGGRQRQGLCLVGNPFPLIDDLPALPLAEVEADTIKQMAHAYGYPSSQIRHLSREEASKQQLLAGLDAAYYAHLALHGVYDASNPLKSRLVLAGNGRVKEQERCLTLGEILQGTVTLTGVRLLVLSACDTSLVDLRRIPDEVVGLAAGFLQAGVAGVIASLWQVDETATYLLMVQFARQYLDPQGVRSPARALAQAQRWLRQEANNRVLASYDPLKDTLILSMMPEASQMLYNRTILKLRRQARVQLETAPDACPYADPRYWAAFMVTGY